MKRRATNIKLSELSESQKYSLASRLDRNTGYGLLTIMRVINGEAGDMTVVEVCQKFGMSDRQAKIHARKIVNSEAAA